jgi:hypothetical protein
MSKTKRRESSELEHFKGQIRKLESENKQLKKRLRALDKKQHLYDDIVQAVAEDIIIDDKCEKCKTGTIKLVDVKYAKFLVCDECKNRKKV